MEWRSVHHRGVLCSELEGIREKSSGQRAVFVMDVQRVMYAAHARCV